MPSYDLRIHSNSPPNNRLERDRYYYRERSSSPRTQVCKGTHPLPINLLKSYTNPTSAIYAFLEEEERAARARIKQCGNFLSHKISGILDDEEIRQAIYELRKKIDTDLSSILRLLSLIR